MCNFFAYTFSFNTHFFLQSTVHCSYCDCFFQLIFSILFLSPSLPPSLSTDFDLDYYTEVLDLHYLLAYLSDNPFFQKYKKLNEALIGLVEEYSLVSFLPLAVEVYFERL